jgi:Mg2+ and Co2+ transporter CorA
MVRDLEESTSLGTHASTDPPRVKAVACLGGVSLERDIPTGEIHDYIRDPDIVVWVDVESPGPSEIAMLIDELGFHPLALELLGDLSWDD